MKEEIEIKQTDSKDKAIQNIPKENNTMIKEIEPIKQKENSSIKEDSVNPDENKNKEENKNNSNKICCDKECISFFFSLQIYCYQSQCFLISFYLLECGCRIQKIKNVKQKYIQE